MSKYVNKNNYEVEAIQWKGSNREEIQSFCGDVLWFQTSPLCEIPVIYERANHLHITLIQGDWIIKDKEGCCEVIDPKIFGGLFSPLEELVNG